MGGGSRLCTCRHLHAVRQASFAPPQHTLSARGATGLPHCVVISATCVVVTVVTNSGGGVVGGTIACRLTASIPVLLVLGLFGQEQRGSRVPQELRYQPRRQGFLVQCY